MNRLLTIACLFCAVTFGWQSTAKACGGGFGDGLEIDTSQKIVVAFKGGVETYVFSPHFCGRAASFGLILPVPSSLTKSIVPPCFSTTTA